MRNWQPLLRRVNSRTSKGSMSLLQQRGLSVTEVVVEVGGKVLLDTERCPSEVTSALGQGPALPSED